MYRGERFNSITHLVGAVAALSGLIVLVVIASLQGDPWKIVSFSIYGTTLFILYTISTIYHSLPGRGKKLFRQLDYHSIYLLIAGTYTPFALVTMRGAWGWSIFGVVWGLATLGMLIEFLPQNGGHRIISVIIYLVMGWVVVVALKPLLKSIPFSGFIWLLTGGLFYTFGVIFYALDGRFRHFHGVWHLFVLAGSTSHFITVLFYVA